MKSPLSLATLTVIPLLVSAIPALSQDARPKPPQSPPPPQVEDVTVELRQIHADEAHRGAMLSYGSSQIEQPTATADTLRRAIHGASIQMASRSMSHPGPSQALIIRTDDLAPGPQSQLEEDLNVMSRIIEKATRPETARSSRAMGINLVFGPNSDSVRSLYLQGYGALFMADVDFPLLPPPAPESGSTEESKSETETTWEQTREELYGVPRPPEPLLGIGWTAEHAEGRAYDAEKVEQLRQRLLEVIKNATNIRQLAADESVTLCVAGSPASAEAGVRVVRRKTTGGATVQGRRSTGQSRSEERLEEIVVDKALANDLAGDTRAVMTLQARKSDIDRFARGEISLDQFRELVRTQTYASSGGWGFPDPTTRLWNPR